MKEKEGAVVKNVLIGGTFDNLHEGHREFIRRAFRLGGRVLVCITSDEMARKKPCSERIEGFEKRKENLLDFLEKNGFRERSEIVKISDAFTEGLRPQLTHIVVSEETAGNAEKINEMRRERGLRDLEIVEIDWVRGEDGKPISDERIRKKEIDENGNLL